MSDENVSVFGTNIASSIPLPAPLVLTKGNLAVSWRRFKDQFQTYEKATLLNAQPTSRRADILLSAIGSDAYDIFQSMNFDSADDRENVDKVIEAFDNFCIGEINVSYERYVLNQRIQDKNESFDNFLSEVRRLIKLCDFGALTGSIIRDRIICGIRDETTRQKLLQIRKLDLAKAIDICRPSETAQRHLRDMRPSAEVSQVKTSSRHHPTRPTRQPRSIIPFRGRAHSDRSQSRTPQQAKQCKIL